MLHLIKLAVGVRDIEHLRVLQAHRALHAPPLRHLTRSVPRRAEEVRAGGSIFWVIGGAILVRQRVLDIAADRREDGSACAGLILCPELVAVEGRPVKPFQGWRYLEAAAAPPDLLRAAADGEDALPDALRRDLRALALL